MTPKSICANSQYKAASFTKLNQQMNPTPEGLPPKGSRPPITLDQLGHKQKPMNIYEGVSNVATAMLQDDYHPSNSGQFLNSLQYSSSTSESSDASNVHQVEQGKQSISKIDEAEKMEKKEIYSTQKKKKKKDKKKKEKREKKEKRKS
ncbi:MAG: hypothetical protein EZS28_045318 [Streblomastix strix]|uniref:Uncharacterized protein n=1 Tax=Streblomastix strix TaxID=222440 RepID=A0A5J4TNX6_9EUKA|nr:MAG: hypothetical protein EZS28_045318 [Streblomastix strix]